ncbi:MAG: tRNA lysidine(34) synthetase TilS [Hyphomicrobiaceae bacterium]
MPHSTQPAPLTNAETATLFADLVRFPLVVLAVSGGPDSLALLHLYARWRASIPNPPATLVLTVDHALRLPSAAEAQFVATQAAHLNLPHETLIWSGPKPAHGLSAAARVARYGLLKERLAREPATPRALLTAHTQDDQAETLLMRLARGSGLEGLAAMQHARPLDGHTTLIRPFLTIAKARLEASLLALGQTWITDPTNANLIFERPRLRQSEHIRASAGLTNANLALTASRLSRANDALDAATGALASSALTHTPGLTVTIDRPAFDAAPLEIRIRLLSRALNTCGGIHPAPQLSEVERLAARLTNSNTATTLGGCLVIAHDHAVLIAREPGRTGLPRLDLAPGQSALWDARFQVALSARAPGPCTVRALTPDEWTALRRLPEIPALAAHTALAIPSFWHADHLVAAPTLGRLTNSSELERQLHGLAPDGQLRDFGPCCAASPVAHMDTP